MLPFILSHRLQRLSRSIISCTFQGEQERSDIRQASNALYEDMLQYQTEHPGTTYQDIYRHFTDDSVRHAVKSDFRQRRLLLFAILCILAGAVFLLALPPVCSYLIQHVSTSFSTIQY